MALRHSVLGARVPECQKIRKGGLDQYDAERFSRLIFATIIKSVGLKGLKQIKLQHSNSTKDLNNSVQENKHTHSQNWI